MYPAWVEQGLILLLLIWIIVLSYLLWRERNFLRALFPKSESRDIRNKFKELAEVIDQFAKQNQLLSRNFRQLAREGLNHIQRVAILRYNPYQDTGGNMSFSLALLNGNLDGVIITSLHSRSGTRVYTKTVNAGKSELELSREEKEVLKRAVEDTKNDGTS